MGVVSPDEAVRRTESDEKLNRQIGSSGTEAGDIAEKRIHTEIMGKGMNFSRPNSLLSQDMFK